jgi:glycogen synthase
MSKHPYYWLFFYFFDKNHVICKVIVSNKWQKQIIYMMSNHKKILILSWEMFPVYAGGLGILTQNVVDEMERQGVEVTVLIPHKQQSSNNKNTISLDRETRKYYKTGKKVPNFSFNIDNFRTSNRNSAVIIPTMFLRGNKDGQPNLYPNHTPLLTQAYAYAVRDYVELNSDFDLIIGMDWMSIASFVMLQQEKSGIPFWFYVNSTEIDRTPDNKFLATAKAIWGIEAEHFKQADRVVAISSTVKNTLLQDCGVPTEKVLVVSNHVDFSPHTKGFPELDKGKNVLFIGRLAQQKGLSFLLDTAERVLSFDRNVKFIIAGDGEGLAEAVTSVCERKMENNVLFTGWVNMDQKRQLYRSSDLFVMSSPSEPFGLTPLEAVISGVPVISSRKCGFLDVIPSTPTYDYHDTSRFAELILYYLNNPEKAQELIAKQKQELSQHSWQKEIAKILYEVKK